MITILPDEFVALRRLKDCFEDGEGYDIATSMVQRLACIGLIRRTHAQHYELTEFGQAVVQHGNYPATGLGCDDTLRIDWLDAQEHIHALQWQCGPRGSPIKTSFYDRNRVLIAEGISLRHAIDAAMHTQEAT
ncbi:hypothetical protein [Collimonas sp.]|jgi:hypothetical protein|uniref:hypothetical protein n=1 Tax=Collimonas sp. TaxID=1963772 RepID=UPI002C7194EE|nr:hypothetical protein [Collimonas sp.]HWW99641.1 hypothetical protein [Collimonas sp.]